MAALGAVSARPHPAWGDVADAHTAIRPHWTLERMAAQHEDLVEGLERTGPQALREHLEAGRRSILSPQK